MHKGNNDANHDRNTSNGPKEPSNESGKRVDSWKDQNNNNARYDWVMEGDPPGIMQEFEI